jgi:hypothetical protein
MTKISQTVSVDSQAQAGTVGTVPGTVCVRFAFGSLRNRFRTSSQIVKMARKKMKKNVVRSTVVFVKHSPELW